MEYGVWRPRLGRSASIIALLAGDLAVVSGLILYGTVHHGADPISDAGYVATVLAPFFLGWLATAGLTGAYAADGLDSISGAVIHGTVAWIPAVLVGALLRATPWFPGDSPPIFVGVVGGFGLLAFVAWRALAALVARRLA